MLIILDFPIIIEGNECNKLNRIEMYIMCHEYMKTNIYIR